MPHRNYCINCKATVDPDDHDPRHTVFADVAKKEIAQLGTLVSDALAASAGKKSPTKKRARKSK